MSHQSKIAVVTGGGSGIGRACAIGLAEKGWSVVIAGRRQAQLEETAALAPRIIPVVADVADEAAVDAVFARVRAEFGRLDLLFNNAGRGLQAEFGDITLAQWNSVVSVNLTGAFLCARAAWRMMKEQAPQGGRIVNNGSISAYAPRPDAVAYTTTKHAITGLTRQLSLDGRKYNIACGQLDIGNAATEMTDRMAAGIKQANGDMMVEPRMDVKCVADALVCMAEMPLDANVQFMTVMATRMPFVGRG